MTQRHTKTLCVLGTLGAQRLGFTTCGFQLQTKRQLKLPLYFQSHTTQTFTSFRPPATAAAVKPDAHKHWTFIPPLGSNLWKEQEEEEAVLTRSGVI